MIAPTPTFHAGLREVPLTTRVRSPVQLAVLTNGVADLAGTVHWQAVEACQVLLGYPMADPSRRRTRRL